MAKFWPKLFLIDCLPRSRVRAVEDPRLGSFSFAVALAYAPPAVLSLFGAVLILL